MDMSKLRRELDGLKGGLEDINSLLVKTETSSKDMVQRLANLSSIAHKGNKSIRRYSGRLFTDATTFFYVVGV